MREDFRLVVAAADERHIQLAGTLDDSFESMAVPPLPPGQVEVDLGHLQGLNSVGVRWWVSWLGDMELRGTDLVFSRCPRAVVVQMNLINNFLGARARVRSFQLPYFCPRCNRDELQLVQIDELDGPPFRAPSSYCDRCDQALEFDDLEEVYFSFMARLAEQGRLTPPPQPGAAPGRPADRKRRAGDGGDGSGGGPSQPSTTGRTALVRGEVVGPARGDSSGPATKVEGGGVARGKGSGAGTQVEGDGPATRVEADGPATRVEADGGGGAVPRIARRTTPAPASGPPVSGALAPVEVPPLRMRAAVPTTPPPTSSAAPAPVAATPATAQLPPAPARDTAPVTPAPSDQAAAVQVYALGASVLILAAALFWYFLLR